jgi:hypothetical protein
MARPASGVCGSFFQPCNRVAAMRFRSGYYRARRARNWPGGAWRRRCGSVRINIVWTGPWITTQIRPLGKAEEVYLEIAAEVRAPLDTGFVFGNAYLRRDARVARRCRDRMEAKKPAQFNGDYWMAHCALPWIEGNLDVANDSWPKGIALVQQLPQAGAYEFDRHCFALLGQAMDEPATAI